MHYVFSRGGAYGKTEVRLPDKILAGKNFAIILSQV